MAVSEAMLRLLAEKTQVRTLTGEYRGLDGDRFTVDVGGGRVPAYPLADYLPAVNERVVVWLVDDVAFVAGPVAVHPVDGTVVSVSSGIVTVSTTAGNIEATHTLGTTPTAGQYVKLLWGGDTPHALLKSTSPAGGTAADNPTPGTAKSYDQTFGARGDSGSYGSSWWTAQVWSSDNNLGAWFYGTRIADTIPSGATIKRVRIYLSAEQIFGSPMNIGLHNHATRPGGSPTIGSTVALAPAGGWLDLPLSFGNALRRSGGQRGIGIVHGGYHIFRSVAQDGQSGALRINYTA
jgi:hypothetical protein